MRHACVAGALLLSLGCAREGAASATDRPEAPSSAASAPKVALGPRLSRPASADVAALGDLHGDLDATKKALRLVGAIDASDAWVGKKLVVVHTGDSIDRGNQDREVLDFLDDLKLKARAAGGELIATLGNHEVMNVAGDFRYVAPASFEEFVSEGGRNAAFGPGGPYARKLADRPLLMKVGDTVFVHGGILPKHVAYGLDRMDEELRDYVLGKREAPPAIVSSDDGPLWTRAYSTEPANCGELTKALDALGAKRMVVGHTVQAEGVTEACDGKVWRIDVGMSRAYGGPIQAIVIRDGAVIVRK